VANVAQIVASDNVTEITDDEDEWPWTSTTRVSKLQQHYALYTVDLILTFIKRQEKQQNVW